MDDLNRKQFERILIIKPSSFGDVIHALPILHGLRRRYPQAKISWLVSTACISLLDGHPELDEAIPFDRKYYGKIGRSWTATTAFIDFLKALRGRRFDLVIDLQGLFRSGFMSLACGAKARMGFARTREFAWLFYNRRITVPRADMHAADKNYRFARALGFGDIPMEFILPRRPEAADSVHNKLKARGLSLDGPFALLGPTTRWETKQWPTQSFASLADGIADRWSLPVVLMGAPDETAITQQVARLADRPVIDLAGQTSIPELIELIARATVAVTNDSGPMHLAAALHCPLVALYGPTNPQRTGPYGKNDSVVRLDLPCSPCYLKKIAQCPHAHRCMGELSVEQVLERIEQTIHIEVPSRP